MWKADKLSGTNLCITKRKFNIDVVDGLEANKRRGAICRQAIIDYKAQKFKTIEEVKDHITEAVSSVEGLGKISLNEQIEEACTLAEKYINADTRLCSEPRTKVVKAFGEEFSVTPALCYEEKVVEEIDGNEVETPLVEVIHLTSKQQEASTSSGNLNLTKALEPMCYALYGVEMLKGRDGYVKITYDALKTSEDKHGDYSRPWAVLPLGARSNKTYNSISVVYSYKDGKLLDAKGKEIMPNYEASWKKFQEGVEKCSQADCKNCDLYQLCNYHRPPVKKDEKVVKRALKDIQYSDAQMRIINFRKGVARANCGAGSGKTQVVVMRIFTMLTEGVKPEEILMTTFTDAGVDEMRTRLKECCEEYEIDVDVAKVKIATFNSLGSDVISRYYKELGFTDKPTLIDNIEKTDIITSIVEDADTPRLDGFDYKNAYMVQKGGGGGAIVRLRKEIERIRDYHLTKEEYLKTTLLDSVTAERIWGIYEKFARTVKERNLIDFADQSLLVEEMWEKDEFALINLFKFKHIIVDEFQDSNDFQLRVIQDLMATYTFESLMVVGDDNQAIYAFRGAYPDNIINLSEVLGVEVDDFYLNENYRSTIPIVECANEIVAKNTKRIVKNMTASRNGDKPLFKAFSSEKAELEWVADKIKELIDSGVSPNDIAFLSFRKTTANSVGKKLADRNILAMPSFSENYLTESRVLAVISLAKFFRNPEDTKSLMNYLNELYNNTFFNRTVDEVNKIIEVNKEDFLNTYLSITLEEKKDYFLNLVNVLDDGTDDIFSKFLDVIKAKERYSVLELIDYIIKMDTFKSDDGAKREGNYGAVAISTAHSSKGREWKYVFTSLTDFDNAGISMSLDEVEERRRLIFVAVTRAKDNLTVTCCDKIKSETEKTESVNRWWNEMRHLQTFKVDATGVDEAYKKVGA